MIKRLACFVIGHDLVVSHPNLIQLHEFSFLYAGTFSFCDRCGKRVDAGDKKIPMLMPENH